MNSVALKHRFNVSFLLDLLEGHVNMLPKDVSSSGGFMLKPLKSGRCLLFLVLFLVAISVVYDLWHWYLSSRLWWDCRGGDGRGVGKKRGVLHSLSRIGSKDAFFR